MGVTEDKLLYLAETKRQIREAIESKGIAVTDGDTFRDYAVKIHAIDTGRDYSNPDYDDPVRFFDYDGALLYSYSVNEFLALSFMPALPTCSGLICQGWTHDLDYAQNFAEEYGAIDIGATYITDDGSTRFYIEVIEGAEEYTISFSQSQENGTIVNWGDGTTEVAQASGTVTLTHTYAYTGNYCISLKTQLESNITFINSFLAKARTRNSVKAIEFGLNISDFNASAFASWSRVQTITIPQNIINISGGSVFMACESLKHITLPRGLRVLGTSAFSGCSSLKTVVLPTTLQSLNSNSFYRCRSLVRIIVPKVGNIGQSCFYECEALRKVVLHNEISTIGYLSSESKVFQDCNALEEINLPNVMTSIWDGTFYGCNFRHVDIPQKVVSIQNSAFSVCSSLVSVSFPPSVNSIGSTFTYCASLKYADFSRHTDIPKIVELTFSNSPDDLKIIVPHWLYDDWIITTNWSTLASYITKDIDISECTSLIITSAKDVVGNATTTKVQYRAVVNGTRYNGEYVTGVVVTGTGTSNEFPQNTSSNAITREISFTLGGRTATTTITHKKYRDLRIICTYKATSTSNNTQLLYSSFSQYSEYFEPMMTVDGSEVALANAYKFSATGNHEVIFKVRTDAEITTLYYMFNNITTLTEVDFCDVDLSAATSTATTYGTACLFYGCTGLTSVTLPDTIQYLGYRMFYNCKAMKNLTIPLSAAPEVYGSDTFGSSSYWMGYNNRSAGTNKLRVPAGATGYDVAPWKSYVLNTSYCGFAIEEY